VLWFVISGLATQCRIVATVVCLQTKDLIALKAFVILTSKPTVAVVNEAPLKRKLVLIESLY
jgi:hypothetical protein